MLARRNLAAPFNSRTTSSIFFKALASVCSTGIQAALVAEVDISNLRRYDHRLCTTLHMYDKKGGFAIRLRNLFGLFEDFFVQDACRQLIGIVGIATASMSYPQIKTTSYKRGHLLRKEVVRPWKLYLHHSVVDMGSAGKAALSKTCYETFLKLGRDQGNGGKGDGRSKDGSFTVEPRP